MNERKTASALKKPTRPRSTAAYLVIDAGARVGTTSWVGCVIIGEEGIYIFKESEWQFRPGDLDEVVVAVAIKIFSVAADRVFSKVDLTGTPYAQLPHYVRADEQWPVKEPMTCEVLVIPRDSIRVVHHVFGAHELELEFSGTSVAIKFGHFVGGRIRRFLVERGWPLVWNGTRFNIAAEAFRSLAKPRSRRLTIVAFTLVVLCAGYVLVTGYLELAYNQHPSPFLQGCGFVGALLAACIGVAAFMRGL